MNEITFCTIAFRQQPIEELWQPLAKIGYDGLEIFWSQLENKSDSELNELAKIGRDTGCPALVISPYLCFTRGRELFDESIERLKRVVDAAHILGAPKVRTFVDVGPTGVASNQASEDQWHSGIEGLSRACEMDSEITFLLETHVKTLADSAAGVERIFDTISPANLKLIVHPCGESDFAGVAGFKKFASRIDHMHLNNEDATGEKTWVECGVFDYKNYFAQIKPTGYTGSVAVEYCWPGATWENAESAYPYLRSAISGGLDR